MKPLHVISLSIQKHKYTLNHKHMKVKAIQLNHDENFEHQIEKREKRQYHLPGICLTKETESVLWISMCLNNFGFLRTSVFYSVSP